MLTRIINKFKENKYNRLWAVCALAVVVKFVLFYGLIGISSNKSAVMLISLVLTGLLFYAFKNKWIPAIIYAVISVLLFADVTYYSFFSKYLSVDMIGAAEVLGNIGESIKEVIRPVNFTMIADAVLIIFSLAIKACLTRKQRRVNAESEQMQGVTEVAPKIDTEDAGETVATLSAGAETVLETAIGTEEKAVTIAALSTSTETVVETASEVNEDSVSAETVTETDANAEVAADTTTDAEVETAAAMSAVTETGVEAASGMDADAEAVADTATDAEAETAAAMSEDAGTDTEITTETGTEPATETKREGRKPYDSSKLKRRLAALTMAVIVFSSISLSGLWSFSTAIKNQEIYTYHVSDILDGIFEKEEGSLQTIEDGYALEKKGPLFGVAKDKNLVFIQIESFMNFVIGMEYNDTEITPNLNKLIKNNSIYFDNFWQQVGSGNTSDAEFAANNSIYGTVLSYTYKVYGEDNYFRGLPVLLKEKGYQTAVFHGFEDMTFWNRDKAYNNLGFDRYYGGLIPRGGDYKMTEWMGWGLTDSEFFKQTVPLMKANLESPYYAFVNMLSNHHPFEMLNHYKFVKLLPEEKGTLPGKYLQSAAYTDYSIGLFMDELKEAGLYEDCLFVLYGDHAGLTHSEEVDTVMEKLLGKPYDYDTMLNMPLIIHMPWAENAGYQLPETVHVSGGHMDIMPTVAYLMGFDTLDTIYFGHNLLTVKENLVPEQTFIKRGSFVYGDIMYEMALDGVFENGRAWNTQTGEKVPLEGLKEHYLKSMEIINASEYVLKTDALRTIYLEGGDFSSVEGKNIHKVYPDKLVEAGYPSLYYLRKDSAEAVAESYNAGYKYIRLTLHWGEGGDAAYTTDEAGNITMGHEELIAWMTEHSEVIPIVDIDGEYIRSLDNTLTFFGQQGEDGTYVGKRIILVAENTKDFTGRHDLFLDVSACSNTNEELMNFIDINNVWAIIMSKDDAEGRRKELLEANCAVYIDNGDGLTERYMGEQ